VVFASNDETARVPLDSLIANKSTMLLRKCEQDLNKEGIGIIPFPNYVGMNEEERLRVLIEETTTPEFQTSEVKNVIRQYLDELRSLYPNDTSKTITIDSSINENCFKNFCKCIKNFDKYDFICHPYIRIQQRVSYCIYYIFNFYFINYFKFLI
jgi:hypothetical protein